MDPIAKLTAGFKDFRDDGFQEKRATYEALVSQGQKPKVAVIACSDSRVDPATVLQADPGDLFIVRNVANLVPPDEQDGKYHGTSAALEYAVQHLEVEHLIVLGHAHCGGIRSMFEEPDEGSEGNRFVLPWMSLVRSAYLRIQGTMPNASEDEKARVCEQSAELVYSFKLNHLEVFMLAFDEYVDRSDRHTFTTKRIFKRKVIFVLLRPNLGQSAGIESKLIQRTLP